MAIFDILIFDQKLGMNTVTCWFMMQVGWSFVEATFPFPIIFSARDLTKSLLKKGNFTKLLRATVGQLAQWQDR